MDGSYAQEALRVEHQLVDSVEENRRTVTDSLVKLLDHFQWNTVVGLSITQEVAERLGVASPDVIAVGKEVTALLSKLVGRKVTFWNSVMETQAEAKHELVWGGSAQEERFWRDKMVAVCTLGQHVGVVLFNNGQHVRCPPLKQITRVLEQRGDGKFIPPEPEQDSFGPWATAVDERLSEVLADLKHAERLIVVPTGRISAATAEALEARLERTRETALSKDCEISWSSHNESAVVQGAALSSLVQLEMLRITKAMAQLVEGKPTVQELSEAQLRAIFQFVDEDCSGKVSEIELAEALETLLGSQFDTATLFRKMDTDQSGGDISVEEFMDWWRREVRQAPVVTVTSADAWRSLLAADPDRLTILKVSFTFCRGCKKFAPVFARMAQKYKEVRFAHLVGNGSIGAMELATKELGVTKSPAFVVFRGGEVVRCWSGSKADVFEDNLNECIQMA